MNEEKEDSVKDGDEGQKKGGLDNLSKEELAKRCKKLLLIAQQAKSAKDEAIEEARKLRQQLDLCQSKSNEVTAKRQAEMEKQITVLQETLTALTEQKLELTVQIDSLKTKNENLAHSLEKARSNEEQFKSKLMEFHQRVYELDSLAESHKRRTDRLTKENDDLISKLHISEEKYNALQVQREADSAWKGRVQEILKQNEVLKSEVETLQKDKSDSAKAKEMLETKGFELQNEVERLNLHITAIVGERSEESLKGDELRKDKEVLEKKCSELESEIHNLHARIGTIISEKDNLSANKVQDQVEKDSEGNKISHSSSDVLKLTDIVSVKGEHLVPLCNSRISDENCNVQDNQADAFIESREELQTEEKTKKMLVVKAELEQVNIVITNLAREGERLQKENKLLKDKLRLQMSDSESDAVDNSDSTEGASPKRNSKATECDLSDLKGLKELEKEKLKLEESLHSVMQEKDQLLGNLKKYEEELSVLKEDNANIRLNLEAAKRTLSELENKLCDEKKTNTKLLKEKANLLTEHQTLCDESDQFQATLRDVTIDLQNAKGSVKEKDDLIAQLERCLTELREEQKAVCSEKETLANSMKNTHEDVSKYQQQLAEKDSVLAKLQKHVDTLDSDYSAAKTDLNNQILELKNEMEIVTKERDGITSQLSSLQLELEEAKTNYDKLQAEFHSQLNEKTIIIEEQGKDLSVYAEEEAGKNSLIESLQMELEELKLKLANLEAHFHTQLKEKECSITTSASNITMLQEQVAEKDSLLGQLRKELEEATVKYNELERELEEYKSICEQLEENGNQLQIQLTERNSSIHKLNKEIENMQMKHAELEESLNCQLEDKMACAKAKNQQIAEEHHRVVQQLDSCQSELEQSSLEVDKLKDELKNFQVIWKEREDELLSQIDERENFVNQLKDTIKELRLHQNETDADKKDLLSETHRYQEEMLECHKVTEDKDEEIRKLKTELDDMYTRHSAVISDLRDHIERLKDEAKDAVHRHEEKEEQFLSTLNSTSCELAEIKSQLKHSEEIIKEKGTCIEKLEEELNNVRERERILQENENSQKEEIQKLKDDLVLQCKILEDKENELENIRRELANTKQLVARKEEEHNHQLEMSTERLESKLREIEDLNDEVANLRNSSAEADGNLLIIKGDLEKASEENEKLQKKISELEYLLKEAESQSQSAQKDLETMQGELEHMKAMASESEELKAKLKAELEASEGRNKEMLSEMNEMNQVIKQRGETISKLNNSTLELEKCKKELEDKVNLLQKDLEHGRKELTARQETLEKLEDRLRTSEQFQTQPPEGKEEAAETVPSSEIQQLKVQVNALEKEKVLFKKRISELEREAETAKEGGEGQSEVMSSSTISKAEESSRLKDVEESFEDRYTKLRMVAVKLKKKTVELAAQITQLSSERNDLNNKVTQLSKEKDVLSTQAKNAQTLHLEFDKLQDECELQKKEAKSSQKLLESSVKESTSVKMQLQEMKEGNQKLMKDLENASKEKASLEYAVKELKNQVQNLRKEKELESTEKKDKIKLITMLEEEIKSKEKKLQEENERCKSMQEELDQAKQESKKKSLLSLEMADYERTVADLIQQLEHARTEIDDSKRAQKSQEEVTKSLEEQIQFVEKQCEAESQRAQEMKEQVAVNRSRISELENTISENEQTIATLSSQVEQFRGEIEDLSLQLSSLAAEKQRLAQSGRNQQETLMLQVRMLEEQLAKLKDEVNSKDIELKAVKEEFEGYKIRAQSVLRQQRAKQNSPTKPTEDLQEQKWQLEQMVETLQRKLEESGTKLQALTLEQTLLTDERDRFQQQCNELTVVKERLLKHNEDLISQLQSAERSHQDSLQQHNNQLSILKRNYQNQMSELQEQHKSEILVLKQELEEVELVHPVPKKEEEPEIPKSKISAEKSAPVGASSWSFIPVKSPSDEKLEISLLEREDGEGSESVESASPYPNASQGRKDFVPLDQLLASPSVPEETSIVSDASHAEIDRLNSRLSISECRIRHLSSLLSEAESDVARLSQLNEVLKEEIRRQQRNEEREEHAKNLEYLKNVVLKFLTLQGGDEKSRLVPVLNTILKLSPEETNQLAMMARGGAVDGQANAKGWGSYLHLWSSVQ